MFQVLHQIGALRTRLQMGYFFFIPAAFDHVRQDFLKFMAIHGRLLPPLQLPLTFTIGRQKSRLARPDRCSFRSAHSSFALSCFILSCHPAIRSS
jgi:hypothetical protein